MSRDRILARIRAARRDTDPVSLPEGLPVFPDYTDPVEQFRAELETAGGVFWDGRETARLLQALRFVLSECGSREIVWESRDILIKHRVPHEPDGLQPEGAAWLVSSHPEGEVEFPLRLRWETYDREKIGAIETSVSTAMVGIAETGTVVNRTGRGVGRVLSVLPPNHVTLLSEDALILNHADFFRQSQLYREGSALTLSTGPSRTADIEKTLVLGVHGPRKWFVILTE